MKTESIPAAWPKIPDQTVAQLRTTAQEVRGLRQMGDSDIAREIVATFESELRRRTAAGLLTAHDADVLRSLSMPAPKAPTLPQTATPSAGEARVLRELITETRAVLRELRDAKAQLPDDAALAESVIVRAASFASDQAVAKTREHLSGDITLQYDAAGRLVSYTSASGVTHLRYDANGKLVKFERRLDA